MGTAELQEAPAASAANGASSRQDFMKVYATLREELAQDPLLGDQTPAARQWLLETLDYNVPGGKLNRGMAVLDVLRALKGDQEITSEEAQSANILGWCIEWLQAFFLVADDIMDNSITRRGQPCWYRVKKVGLVAINDGIVLESCIYRILQKHFRRTPQYMHLLELFHETTHQTSHGQLLDLITAPIGTVDLKRYTTETYMRIVTYKTAYYSFYLPTACGLLIGGVSDDASLELAKDICVRMGQYFQIQDDYLDCYGDPEVIGKIGTDIEDNKCSWLVVQALETANPEQRQIIEENYGKPDGDSVQKIKAVYNDLGLEQRFFDYEQASYEKLTQLISDQSSLPQGVFTLLLGKIYKRKK
jgi:farnesyl diphosphate synthase